MEFPLLPNGGSGYQIGDGNISEFQFLNQNAPVTFTDNASLSVNDLIAGILIHTDTDDNDLTLPTVAALNAAFSSAKVNSCFEFSLISTSTGSATIVTNTGWSLVGEMEVDEASGRFLARKTSSTAWSLYRIA